MCYSNISGENIDKLKEEVQDNAYQLYKDAKQGHSHDHPDTGEEGGREPAEEQMIKRGKPHNEPSLEQHFEDTPEYADSKQTDEGGLQRQRESVPNGGDSLVDLYHLKGNRNVVYEVADLLQNRVYHAIPPM